MICDVQHLSLCAVTFTELTGTGAGLGENPIQVLEDAEMQTHCKRWLEDNKEAIQCATSQDIKSGGAKCDRHIWMGMNYPSFVQE